MTDDQELRARALRNLLRALQEAGPELSPSWVAHGDPDLRALRGHEAWQTLIRRLSRLRDEPSAPVSKLIATEADQAVGIASDAEPYGMEASLAARSVGEATDSVARPESPLRPAAFRQWAWFLMAVAFAGAAVVAGFSLGLPGPLSTAAAISLLVLAGRAGHRAYIARQERWPELPTRGASKPEPPDDQSPSC